MTDSSPFTQASNCYTVHGNLLSFSTSPKQPELFNLKTNKQINTTIT